MIRRRSLAKLRKEAEPVDVPAFSRLLTRWQGAAKKRKGLDALLDAIDALQGYPLPASIFEREILSARIDDYSPSDLDTLSAAGEIVWQGIEPLGERDGRIALYLTDRQPLLAPPLSTQHSALIDFLQTHGASFFAQIHDAVGGFPNDLADALWSLVWQGLVTNDTFHALRAYTRPKSPRASGFRSRRTAPASTQGRWSLVPQPTATPTEHANALAQQLLARYGVVVREAAAVESLPGGFSAVYPVLKAMEEAGRIRRGYFIAGLGASQFATAGAIDLLRSFRDESDEPETVMLASTDPANPYGALVKWPVQGPMRNVGSSVILVDGALGAYVGRGEKQLQTFLPDDEPCRSLVAREIAKALASLVERGARRALLLADFDEALGPYLVEAGFRRTASGYQLRARVA